MNNNKTLEETFNYIKGRTDNVKEISNTCFEGKCPVCGSRDKSANTRHFKAELIKKKIIVNCIKKCEFDDIVAAYGLEKKDFFKNNDDKYSQKVVRERRHIYYYDIYENERKATKVILNLKNGKKKCWWEPKGYKANLYNLDAIKEAPTIFIVEGEKDVETMGKMGFTATTLPHGGGNTKWLKEYEKYLKDKDIVILHDNDNTGKQYKDFLVNNLNKVVKSIRVIDPIQLNPNLPIKGDITDIYNDFGEVKTADVVKSKLEFSDIVISKDEEKVNIDFPKWINEYTYTQEKNSKCSIRSHYFIDDFKKNNDIMLINGKLFNSYGETVMKDDVLQKIQHMIDEFFYNYTANKVNDLYKLIRGELNTKAPELYENKVYLEDSVLVFDEDGNFTVDFEDKTPTIHRFNFKYNPKADEPQNFIKLINDMFYEEDIETIQQYLGLCLVPVTDNQKALHIKGEGANGKSTLCKVLNEIFKSKCLNIKLHKLCTNTFATSQLQNKLLCIDDDVTSDKIYRSDIVKSLFEGNAELNAEYKGQDSFQFTPYARFIILGNTTLSTANADINAFCRRIIFAECKPNNRTGEDTRLLAKIKKEKDGVFNWLLEGLSKVIRHDYVIQESERLQENRERVIYEQDTVRSFVNNKGYIEFDNSEEASTKALHIAYWSYCNDNGLTFLNVDKFSARLKELLADKNVKYSAHVKPVTGEKKVRGYKGVNCKVINLPTLLPAYEKEIKSSYYK